MTFRGGPRERPVIIPDYVRPVVKLVQRHPMVSAAFAGARAVAAAELFKATGELPPAPYETRAETANAPWPTFGPDYRD